MRLILLLAAGAAAASAPPSAPPVTHAQIDVPRTRPQQVLVQSRDFAPGSESGWHVHPGTEVAYVSAGQLELRVQGKTTVLGPGDSFTIPRGVAHNGANPGSATARVVITLVVDKGVAPRQPVPAPKGS
ncbi:MAG: cupin domain-containing protein [Novosphingobium sp.]